MTDNNTAAAIGDRMRRLRMARGKTMAEVAEAIGVTHQAISNIELGKAEATAVRLAEIARALDAPVGYFFGEASVSL